MKTPTSYRRFAWYSEKTQQPVFGIQAKIQDQWFHCSEGNKPLLFDSEIQRDAKLKEMRKKASEAKRAAKLTPTP